MADGSTYQFAYTLTGNLSQTHFVTDGPGYAGGGPGIGIVGFRSCQGCAEGYTPLISQTDSPAAAAEAVGASRLEVIRTLPAR